MLQCFGCPAVSLAAPLPGSGAGSIPAERAAFEAALDAAAGAKGAPLVAVLECGLALELVRSVRAAMQPREKPSFSSVLWRTFHPCGWAALRWPQTICAPAAVCAAVVTAHNNEGIAAATQHPPSPAACRAFRCRTRAYAPSSSAATRSASCSTLPRRPSHWRRAAR